MNGADWVVLTIVGAAVALACAILRRNRRAGKNTCGGDCARCALGCRREAREPVPTRAPRRRNRMQNNMRNKG